MNIHNLKQPFVIWPDSQLTEKIVSAEQQTPMLWNSRIIRNVTVPSLIPYIPEKQNGTTIIICPGGAFQFLMIDKEGTDIAEWLNSFGITAFILKYRLVPTPIDDMKFKSDFESTGIGHIKIKKHIRNSCADGIQAMSIIKQRALEYNIDRNMIGMMGFSAGAMVAVSSVFGSKNSCPNFIGAIYGAPMVLSKVPSYAPPLFIAYANDDDLVESTCLDLLRAWRRIQRPVEAHAYSQGGHGFGLIKQGLPCDSWADNFITWLKSEKYISNKQ
jgi:acetyl esterase/lipase